VLRQLRANAREVGLGDLARVRIDATDRDDGVDALDDLEARRKLGERASADRLGDEIPSLAGLGLPGMQVVDLPLAVRVAHRMGCSCRGHVATFEREAGAAPWSASAVARRVASTQVSSEAVAPLVLLA